MKTISGAESAVFVYLLKRQIESENSEKQEFEIKEEF